MSSAVDAGDFFDEIDLALDVGAPGRLRAFPRGEKRIRRAAIVIDAHWSKTERAKDGFDILVGNVSAHDAQEFRARDGDFTRRALSG